MRLLRCGAPALAFCLALFIAAPAPRAAGDAVEVDLALVLAVDVSDSMTRAERDLQRRGYADALRHPDVVDAIRWGAFRRIALAYMEWAGPDHQRLLVPWTLVGDRATAEAFAARVAAAPPTTGPGTSISGALAAGEALLVTNPFRPLREVVDISGDGPANAGPPVAPARARLIAAGVAINGLPVNLPPDPGQRLTQYDPVYLNAYFANCVVGGHGAFLAEAATPETFTHAILQKLVREVVGGPAVLQMAGAQPAGAAAFDCAAPGERQGR